MKKIDLIRRACVQPGRGYPPPSMTAPAALESAQLGEAGRPHPFRGQSADPGPLAVVQPALRNSAEDEFLWVLAGEVVLITDAGEEVLRPRDCAAFKAGEANGHHLVNRSDQRGQGAGGRQPRGQRPLRLHSDVPT